MKKVFVSLLLFFIIRFTYVYSQSCFLLGDTIKLYESYSACENSTVIFGGDREDGLRVKIFGEDNIFFSFYIECKILKIKKQRAFIELIPIGAYPDNLSKIDRCWVGIEHLGVCYKHKKVDSKNLDDFNIILYKRPNEKSKIIQLDFEPSLFLANVIRIKRTWLKVVVNVNGNDATGWLSPENQCVEVLNRCMGD